MKHLKLIIAIVFSLALFAAPAVSHAQSCSTKNATDSNGPGKNSSFKSHVLKFKSVQFPKTSTCVSQSNLSMKIINKSNERWLVNNSGYMEFKFYGAAGGERMELRGPDIQVKGTGTKALRSDFRVLKGGSTRYTIAQFFGDARNIKDSGLSSNQASDDIAKIQFRKVDGKNRMYLTIATDGKTGDQNIDMGPAPSGSNFGRFELNYNRGANKLTVKYKRKYNDSSFTYNETFVLTGNYAKNDMKVYYKMGTYFQNSGNGKAEFRKLYTVF